MSTKYTGGFITKSPVAPTTTAASGIWTLDQQQQAQKAGTWPSPPLFIEDLFSTYLYTDTGSTQTIVNGIDLASKGGMVWAKCRSAVDDHIEWDSARGTNYFLNPNTTSAQGAYAATFNSNGVSIPSLSSGQTYASWTFAKQSKFFDVVTYTGNGTAGLTINHNLGSVPGCIIVKSMTSIVDWAVYHRSLGATKFLNLNLIGAASTSTFYWNNTEPTSTTFTVGDSGRTNGNGETYVAYLFAHNAGGFPVSGGGSTNGISCGSYTGNGSATGPVIDLGYEPQFVMIKAAENVRTSPTSYNNWAMVDVMRGMPNPSTGTGYALGANLSTAENGGFLAASSTVVPTATGFQIGANESMYNFNGCTYIYIAIRRGPMKTPTTGTSVYGAETWSGNGSSPRTFTSANWTFPADLVTVKATDSAAYWNVWGTRLTGGGTLSTNDTGAELTSSTSVAGYVSSFNQTGYTAITGTSSISNYNNASAAYVSYNIRRAPGFFDVVCYTGNGSTQTVTHNLGVAPELMIMKKRSVGGTSNWAVYATPLANVDGYLFLNDTAAVATSSVLWNSTAPTSTVFSLGASTNINQNGETAIAYLFATLAGVSKVGSYTGTGALQTINCGFTSGARFVMIKRTDSTGGWFYYDSVRGITSGNDPYLFFNVSDAQVTGTNYVDTDTTGFKVTAAAPAEINANGGTFIFLAIA
tara:strand:- start:260 stop:2344 length:2085 start_codon:yes stop_codon:yes gene_type:complete